MSCVLERNEIARAVAAEIGDIFIEDLYGAVEEFCSAFPTDPLNSSFAHNYTTCAIQSTGLHFFTRCVHPSLWSHTGGLHADAPVPMPNARGWSLYSSCTHSWGAFG